MSISIEDIECTQHLLKDRIGYSAIISHSFIHGRNVSKSGEQATSIHYRLLYRQLGSGNGLNELIAIFTNEIKKKKNGLQTRQYRPWPWTEHSGGIPQGEIPFCNFTHPLDANSSKLSSVLQSLMAKWKLITFWLYQILIEPIFKNFPSLLVPISHSQDQFRWGSARDDGKAKGAKLDNVPLPLPQQALYFRKWSLYFKARLSGKLLIGKWLFIPWFSHCGKVLHLASFWKWEFSDLGRPTEANCGISFLRI